MTYNCPMCADFISPSFKLLQLHLFRVHSGNFNLTCCSVNFKTASAYRKHVQRHHSHILVSESSSSLSNGQSTNSLSSNYYSQDEENGSCGDDFDNSSTQLTLRKNTALWILKLKESQKLTQVCLENVLQEVTEMCSVTVSELGVAVNSLIELAGLEASDIPGLDELFKTSSPFCRPFDGLDTYYRQLSFYKEHLHFVNPVRVPLGKYQSWKTQGTGRKLVEVTDEFIYVPIKDVLEQMFQNSIVLEELICGHKRGDGIVADFCDSQHFSSHVLWGSDPVAIQILLYYDELEICNPLGASRKLHKIGCFYFTLGNLHPKYRSALKFIQLLALVKNEHVKNYGLNSVLQHITSDIEELEKGIEFETCEGTKTFRGSIVSVAADNLGSHAIGGFKEGFRALRPCRHCFATTDELKQEFHEDSFVLRTPESHKRMCDHLEHETDAFHSTTYGINRSSPLNNLHFYNTCDFGLPPDIMHDLLEGYVPCKVKLMLKYYIEVKHLFKLQQVNISIANFKYGYMETAPTAIFPTTFSSSNDGDLNQSASKMWTLARYLPLLIGSKIEEDDPHWIHYLELLDILELVFSTTVRYDTPAYLQVILEGHFKTFKELYPQASIIPKMHFMIHIPRYLEQIGPLIRHWTMRYEAKHQYFKKLSHTMGNYINICYSLAMRHQSYQCYNFYSENLMANMTEIGPGQRILVENTEVAMDLSLVVNENSVQNVNWVKVDGVLIKKGVAVITSISEIGEPSFCEIVEIFVSDVSRVWLSLLELETVEFSSHFHSWSIKKTENKFVKSFTELASLQILLIRPARYVADVLHYITLKYAL